MLRPLWAWNQVDALRARSVRFHAQTAWEPDKVGQEEQNIRPADYCRPLTPTERGSISLFLLVVPMRQRDRW